MSENHRKHLLRFLQDKKLIKDLKIRSSAEQHKSKGVSSIKTPCSVHGKFTIHNIPREILLCNIFSYLLPQDLTSVAQVCRDWHSIANDNYLWRPIFEKYDNLSRSCTTSSRSPEVNTPADKSSLKENCMKRCVTSRNRRVLHKMKKKKNLYTGLHDSKDVHLALQVCGGVSWQLSLVDHSDSEHCMVYQDATYHLTTLSLRWFELETLALDQVKEIRIYSINPLFYDVGAQKFIENGPYQRSLIKSFVINWKKWKSQHRAKAGDDLILLYDLSCGIYVATFKVSVYYKQNLSIAE